MAATEQEPITLETLQSGLWVENPVFVMTLGMCSTMAVSNTFINSLAMGLAVTFVLVTSMGLISLLRKFIPKEVRIASYIVIIATFVTMVDYGIQAISLDLYNALGAFIALIVVNCILLARAESHASKKPVGVAMVNALGMGIGYTLALLCLGSVREVLGSGTLLGIPILPASFQPWTVMILPPGGFFVLGSWLLLFSWLKQRQARQAITPQAGLN